MEPDCEVYADSLSWVKSSIQVSTVEVVVPHDVEA